ncbi:MAG: NAD-dependent epimerase/dehydratase family protein [Anaerolineaceae bacterium]|jgi:nucleoside-diphosphate-sugar epimerase
MARYLVTGAAGFIASRVTEFLLADGHSVIGVDNLNDAYDVRMKEYRLQKLVGLPGFTFRRMDISDRQQVSELSEVVGYVDAIINLAARAGVRSSVENPWVYYATNLTGTLNLLDMCQRKGIGKFVLASSSSVYGANPPLPTPEDADTDHPLQPYASSKKAAESLCYTYHYLYGTDVTIFRYFTVYGPAGRPDMVMFRFTQWIAEGRTVRLNGDGKQARGFTYLDDIARGTILGLKPLGFEVINLGGHQVIDINELIGMIEKRLDTTARIEYLPRHPADAVVNYANVEKAGRLLGWEGRVSLEEGVSNLVNWYLAERRWASQVATP